VAHLWQLSSAAIRIQALFRKKQYISRRKQVRHRKHPPKRAAGANPALGPIVPVCTPPHHSWHRFETWQSRSWNPRRPQALTRREIETRAAQRLQRMFRFACRTAALHACTQWRDSAKDQLPGRIGPRCLRVGVSDLHGCIMRGGMPWT
jgi:hypothetical protein